MGPKFGGGGRSHRRFSQKSKFHFFFLFEAFPYWQALLYEQAAAKTFLNYFVKFLDSDSSIFLRKYVYW